MATFLIYQFFGYLAMINYLPAPEIVSGKFNLNLDINIKQEVMSNKTDKMSRIKGAKERISERRMEDKESPSGNTHRIITMIYPES